MLQRKSYFYLTSEHQHAFDQLKQAIISAPTLAIPRDDLPYTVHTDASGFAIGAALMQDHGSGLQPIAFISHKMIPAEQRYATHEQELLAIVSALRQWRHFLYGRRFTIITDHHSLTHFQKQQNLSLRQARWSEFLQNYEFDIVYKPGSSNVVADALSRRHDLELTSHSNTSNSINTVNTKPSSNSTSNSTSTNSTLPLIDRIIAAYSHDEECQIILDNHKQNKNTSTWTVNSIGLIQRQGRILIPNNEPLRTTIIMEHHEPEIAAHRGVVKTVDLISRRFYWKSMNGDIKLFIQTCTHCQQNKISNQTKLGLLQPIATPTEAGDTWTIDFISFPMSKSGHDNCMVCCNKLTKLVHFCPTTTTVTAAGSAKLFFDNVVRLHGIPNHIISDRDARFTSLFWKELWSLFNTKLKLSTSFHPQTDGQTERTNRTLIEMLKNYVNHYQNNWDENISSLEFAYNNSTHSTTGFSPFFLTYGRHPTTPTTHRIVEAHEELNIAAAAFVENILTNLAQAQQNIEVKQAQQKKQYDRVHRDFTPFKVNDLVLLSTTNLRTLGKAPKLLPLRIGPYRVVRVLSKLNYELELPSSLKQIHNVFHVSVLTPFLSTDCFPTRPPVHTRPPALIVDKEEVYEIEKILSHKGNGRTLKFNIHWKGYPVEESTWVPLDNLRNCKAAIHQYEQQKLNGQPLQLNFSNQQQPQVPATKTTTTTVTHSSSTSATNSNSNKIKPTQPSSSTRTSTRTKIKSINNHNAINVINNRRTSLEEELFQEAKYASDSDTDSEYSFQSTTSSIEHKYDSSSDTESENEINDNSTTSKTSTQVKVQSTPKSIHTSNQQNKTLSSNMKSKQPPASNSNLSSTTSTSLPISSSKPFTAKQCAGIKSCARCTHSKNNGIKCKRNTCIYGPKCWQHTNNLLIKKSTIPNAGKGLFSKTTIKKDTIITQYTGELLTAKQFTTRYQTPTHAKYVFKINFNHFIDAICSNSGVGRYANTKTVRSQNNATFTINYKTKPPTANIKATKTIPPNTEIFVHYGPSYKING